MELSTASKLNLRQWWSYILEKISLWIMRTQLKDNSQRDGFRSHSQLPYLRKSTGRREQRSKDLGTISGWQTRNKGSIRKGKFAIGKVLIRAPNTILKARSKPSAQSFSLRKFSGNIVRYGAREMALPENPSLNPSTHHVRQLTTAVTVIGSEGTPTTHTQHTLSQTNTSKQK